MNRRVSMAATGRRQLVRFAKGCGEHRRDFSPVRDRAELKPSTPACKVNMLICPRVFYVGEKNNFIARGFTPSGKLQNDKLNQYSQLSIFLPLSR